MTRVLLCAERRSDFAITAGFLKQGSVRYAVDWAHSFADATARAASRDYQVLLVDAELGMGRGLELLEQHVVEGAATPIVLLVAQHDATFEAAAIRAGAADVLVRDAIDPVTLDRAVRHAALRARIGQPYGFRPGASAIVPIEGALDRIELAIHRARRARLGCAVFAVSYDMPTSARRAAERMGASFFGTLLERVRLSVGADDEAFRVGDHEILVVANALPGARAAAEHGGKLLASLSEAIDIAGAQVRLAAQVGIAFFPDHGADGAALVAHAREAMHSARAGERSQLRMHQTPARGKDQRRADIRRLVPGAIERGELELFFQPKIDIDEERMVGAEALMRWTSRELGPVPPGEFIPVVEELGLIARFGEWALREGCREARRWLDDGLDATVAVNVSAQQFGRSDLAQVVRSALHEAALPPRMLELEITEGLLLENTHDTRDVLDALRAEGVRVAVDDFGTGYASLSYVKRFPMDVIKIDREFVRGLPLDTENVAISSAIVALAQSLGLEVVAEGVETEAEQEFLRSVHCHIVQGFLHARPMPAASLDAWRAARFSHAHPGAPRGERVVP